MPKQKTHKGISKRTRVTRNGKVMRNHSGRRHLMSSKSSKARRQLRTKATIPGLNGVKLALKLS